MSHHARTESGGRKPGRSLSIPNLITLGRILLVPVVVWAIAAGEMRIAFFLFLVAGLSDLVDGFLAKRFGMATELGAYLDPLADKAMIVSIYVALGIIGAIPRWLVILVVSRDIMIVSAVILSWLVDKPVKLKPLTVSKLNTVAQILLALVVLASLAFGFDAQWAIRAHGAGRGLDLAVRRLLCRRVGAPYERADAARAQRSVETSQPSPGGHAASSSAACALDHAESFAREDFLGGPSNAAALALVDRLARWPDRDRWSWSGRKARARATSPRSGRGQAGARFLAARALGGGRSRRRSPPERWWSRTWPSAAFRERALFHLLNLAREDEAFCCSPRARAPAGWTLADPRSRARGSRRCRWSRWRRRTMRCCARCW